MPHDDLQEPLQPFPPMLDHIITEPVREDLAGERGDGNTSRFALEDVAKVFKVRVAPTDGAVLELEGGDVGPADDLVVGVHMAVSAVGLGVFDLKGGKGGFSDWGMSAIQERRMGT